jgi:CIC family chloride channel protein
VPEDLKWHKGPVTPPENPDIPIRPSPAQRWRLLVPALAVGAIAGLISEIFHQSLVRSESARNGLIHFLGDYAWLGLPLLVLLCAAAGGASVWLVRRFAPETAGSGIPQVEIIIDSRGAVRPERVVPVKFLGGMLCIGGGMALGREGPTVQIGGAMGEWIGRLFRLSAEDKVTLIAAGAGAGLAATFHAPLAGMIFVVEELRRRVRSSELTITFVACVAAYLVTVAITGAEPEFYVPVVQIPILENLVLFIGLGVMAGLIGVVYNRSLIRSLDWFERIFAGRPLGSSGLAMGAVVGVVAWFLPGMVGSGDHLLDAITHGEILLAAIIPLFFLRFFLTIGSYGTGAPGGIFAPLLVLGALLGYGVGSFAGQWPLNSSATPNACVVVGMAALFTAIVRAPITGVTLILEMTDGFELMVPMLVACAAAHVVAEGMGEMPIYDALRKRIKRKAAEAAARPA